MLRVQRDADARVDSQREALQRERLIERLADPGGDVDRGLRARSDQQHRELIAAKASDRVLASQRRSQPGSDLEQELVAGDMTEGVVDLLEAVEIQDEHRER